MHFGVLLTGECHHVMLHLNSIKSSVTAFWLDSFFRMKIILKAYTSAHHLISIKMIWHGSINCDPSHGIWGVNHPKSHYLCMSENFSHPEKKKKSFVDVLHFIWENFATLLHNTVAVYDEYSRSLIVRTVKYDEFLLFNAVFCTCS